MKLSGEAAIGLSSLNQNYHYKAYFILTGIGFPEIPPVILFFPSTSQPHIYSLSTNKLSISGSYHCEKNLIIDSCCPR